RRPSRPPRIPAACVTAAAAMSCAVRIGAFGARDSDWPPLRATTQGRTCSPSLRRDEKTPGTDTPKPPDVHGRDEQEGGKRFLSIKNTNGSVLFGQNRLTQAFFFDIILLSDMEQEVWVNAEAQGA
ncbi:MAG: hypothetical protein IJH38_06340, partial [Clostridia bacterium]|nr:hypothetical protein [Clostridia bacterium]